jgi:hypothetical protein
MDVNTVSQLITTLGFPIVCVIAMGYAMWKIYERSERQNETREEKLYDVIVKAQAQNAELSSTNARFVGVLETYKQELDEIKHDVNDIKTTLSKE